MSQEKKKKKFPWKPILIIAAILAISFCAGIGIGKAFAPWIKKLPKDQFFMGLAGAYLWLLLANFLQTVIHEAGHLVFGLLSGYQYCSFRIGSFMWIKQDGKMRLKRFSLAGTGGQCLMAPPELVNGKMPYMFYNMGGCLANFVVSVIPAVIVLVSWKMTYVNCLVMLWVIVGMIDVLMNGIPMKFQGMPNDGHNVLSLGKDPAALRAFWLQMEINAQVSLGKRLKDMPEEWFELPEKEEWKNSMIVATAVFCCNRLMDEGKYREADELMEQLLTEKTGMVGIHRNLLRGEQIYCELVGENRAERLEKLYTDELKAFLKAMKKVPSTFRVEYLYAKFVEKDEERAKKAMENFEKVAKTYPYETESEREMIAYAEEKLG